MICPSCIKAVSKGKSTDSLICFKCRRVFHAHCFNTNSPSSSSSRYCTACSVGAAPTAPAPTLTLQTSAAPPLQPIVTIVTDKPALSPAYFETPVFRARAFSAPKRLFGDLSPPDITQTRKISRAMDSTQNSAVNMQIDACSDNHNVVQMAPFHESTPEWFKPQALQSYEQYLDTARRLDSAFSKIEDLKQDISQIRSDVDVLKQEAAYRDTCELRFSGLPLSALDKHEDSLKRILNKIDCVFAGNHIIKTRVWDPLKKSKDATNVTAAVDASAKTTCALVAMFSSPVVRNEVKSAARKLKNVKASEVFSDGGNTFLYIDPLLPRAKNILWRKCLTAAKELNYIRPFIEGTSIFMRKTPQSTPIPINAESDLLALPMHHPQ